MKNGPDVVEVVVFVVIYKNHKYTIQQSISIKISLTKNKENIFISTNIRMYAGAVNENQDEEKKLSNQ